MNKGTPRSLPVLLARHLVDSSYLAQVVEPLDHFGTVVHPRVVAAQVPATNEN